MELVRREELLQRRSNGFDFLKAKEAAFSRE
jgi:hypothetical protein